MPQMIAIAEKAVARLLIGLIQLYRWVLSPYLGRACRFEPTCSAYGQEALRVHGPWRGSWLTAKRLCRCHPVRALGGGFGFDPVPAPVYKKSASSGMK
jgi:putative membrane protein insertion efficiency factor